MLDKCAELNEYQTVDVAVCIAESRPPIRDITQTLYSLWNANMRTIIIESATMNDAQDKAQEMGAKYMVLFGEKLPLRVRRFNDKFVSYEIVERHTLIDYLKKNLAVANNDQPQSGSYSSGNASGGIESFQAQHPQPSSSNALPVVDVSFVINERLTSTMRRRYESQLIQNMSTTLRVYGKNERVSIVVIDLPSTVLKALVGAIDPMDPNSSETNADVILVVER